MMLKPGILNFDSIQQVCTILNANTASFPATLRERQHGNRIFNLTDKEYNTFTVTTADHAVNLGEIIPAPNNPFKLEQ
eukprot:673258-Ditylum_brightwellii.AAC.1